jgi:hypothetical protein
MTQKNKIDTGTIMALGLLFTILFLGGLLFLPVLPEIITFCLLGASGLVTGTAALYGPTSLISILRSWSEPGR